MPETLRIVPLGGLGEVGKNLTAYEFEDDIVVVDAGLAFPRDEHLGVDLILPDFSYLVDRDRPVRAVLLTHGHEDHVGALPYLLREARVQEVWATRLTLGLIKSKLDEHGLLRSVELREADPDAAPVRASWLIASCTRSSFPGTGFAEMITVSPASTLTAGWSPYAIRTSAESGSPWLPVHRISTSPRT